MERDLTVYIVQQGENPAMAFDTTDLDAYDGIFAVTREEWEESPAFDEMCIRDRFQSHGQWGGRDYANIAPGDAIFFDWDLDGSADYVGLVVGTDGSRVYTVEGNSGDACKIKSYSLTYECIKGYGLMNW